jgi:antirestriction protein ArdC
MSTYKPLSEQIAGRMIMDIKNGTSVFQRPNNSVNSAVPFNIESGHKYAGPSALVLLMQKRDDPRWATSNQANRNHTAVLKNATGTLINFMSQYEYQKVVDGDGQPVLKENGKQRVERIKLHEPKQVDAWLFNGEQLRNMPKWDKEPALLSPAERAGLILDNSKVAIEHGGDDMMYDRATDTIVIPEKEQFASPEQYFAEALHQLAHRELGGPSEDGSTVREELRTNLASLFLSKELNLPFELNYHDGYLNAWSQVIKEEPAELFKAASDAQKIVDKVMGFEQKIEVQQEAGAEEEIETGQQQDEAGQAAGHLAETPKFSPDKLTKGEVIPYNGTEFKVVSELKNKVYNMQNLGSGQKFKMSSKDELYNSLLNAKNYSQERANGIEAGIEEQFHEETAEEEETDYSMSR